jgi:hypothetical protein
MGMWIEAVWDEMQQTVTKQTAHCKRQQDIQQEFVHHILLFAFKSTSKLNTKAKLNILLWIGFGERDDSQYSKWCHADQLIETRSAVRRISKAKISTKVVTSAFTGAL